MRNNNKLLESPIQGKQQVNIRLVRLNLNRKNQNTQPLRVYHLQSVSLLPHQRLL